MGQQANGDAMMGNKGQGWGDGNNDNDGMDGDVDDDNHHHHHGDVMKGTMGQGGGQE